MKPMHRTSGYLLIEAMVAMGVLTTGVLGMLALMSSSIGMTRTINDRYVVNYLAAEGVELTKNVLDSNLFQGAPWNANGFAAEGCYELDYTAAALAMRPAVSCPNGSGTPIGFDGTMYSYGAAPTRFYRTIHVTPIMNGATQIGVQVDSSVRWQGRLGSDEIVLEDKFYAWH